MYTSSSNVRKSDQNILFRLTLCPQWYTAKETGEGDRENHQPGEIVWMYKHKQCKELVQFWFYLCHATLLAGVAWQTGARTGVCRKYDNQKKTFISWGYDWWIKWRLLAMWVPVISSLELTVHKKSRQSRTSNPFEAPSINNLREDRNEV